jgi:pimeloyl-ACP methyl ester carboxylesterase
VTGLVLVDPVLPLVPALPDRLVTPMLAAYAMPVLGPLLMSRRRRKSPEALVTSVLSLCCVDISRVPADIVAQHVTVARESLLSPDVERAIAASARSIITTIGDPRGGAYRRAIQSVTCPVLLLHGVRDRMVPITVARAAARANPAWMLIEIPDVGHVPQLEAAADTARAITGWLGSAGQRALCLSRPWECVVALAGQDAGQRFSELSRPASAVCPITALAMVATSVAPLRRRRACGWWSGGAVRRRERWARA